MASDPLTRYRSLMAELLRARERAGGELSQEVESAYVANLDQIWGQLSDEEQESCEAEFCSPPKT